MRSFLLFAILSTAICVSVSLSAAALYVAGSVSSSGDGASWETAFKNIQEGIDASSDSDTVIVAEGVYIENIRFEGKNISLTSTDPLDPSVVANTIIDGNRSGSVVTFDGTENETCVLSGFTVRNGSRSGGGSGICGGEDEHTHSSIRNNVITMNWPGGLAYCDGAIENNRIVGNSGGGLAYCDGIVRNNVISGNSAALEGGAAYYCSGLFEHNLICGNVVGGEPYGAGSGGGLCFCHGTIRNNTIVGNRAQGVEELVWEPGELPHYEWMPGMGGGLQDCRGIIQNCIIWGNSADEGSQLHASSDPRDSCVSEDPLFVDPDNGDYHVREGSSCIDAGANFYWSVWPQRDVDGNCRLAGTRIDIGCYEHGALPDSDGDLLSDTDEADRGTDPNQEDTDGDRLRDGLEVVRGSNPLEMTPPRVVHVPSHLPTIQESLCLAVDGDEIVVAPGIYCDNFHFCGANVILRSSDPEDGEVVALTILDGRGVGPVVSLTGIEGEATIIMGFTIHKGWSFSWVGGILAGTDRRQSHATIRKNVITDNFGDRGGGVGYCDGTVSSNVISGNQGGMWGGGVTACGGVVENNTITGNRAGSGGGLHGCNGTIENNTIAENVGYNGAGGLQRCDGVIRRNFIAKNMSDDAGGALVGCSGVVESNVIVGNWATKCGGGLYSCHGTIRNNIIVGNRARYVNGGALFSCQALVVNNTIVGNAAGERGGGLFECTGPIQNCIIWGNTAPEGGQLQDSNLPSFCCIQDWTGGGGEGNISDDARFVDADGADDDPLTYEDNNYRLATGSPCIDAGINEDWMWERVDLDGNPRVLGGTVDMGAYEYGSLPFEVIEVTRTAGDGLQLKWRSQPGQTYAIQACSDLCGGSWAEVATVSSDGSEVSWIDPDVSNKLKFYRVEMN